jgi:hypothetical protein
MKVIFIQLVSKKDIDQNNEIKGPYQNQDKINSEINDSSILNLLKK